uniref:Myc protein n=1 Tax=Anthurium amnicola TaxID=1678845 RepID=A0A1D1XY07_9ARAE
MGTVNGGTIISFTPTPSLHAVNSRMPSHHHSNGCANFTFQIPSIANAAKKNTNSAERRANHNAVERARRECLNTKFQELAHALPSLAQVRRPSKSIIVQKSLDFIYNARQKDEMHDKEMRSIRNENDLLREEINKLREQLGLEPYPPREESKPSTSQQADEAKEDAKVSSSKNPNSVEIKIEADNKPTTITNAQESINSADIQIKTEECRSDDDISNGNTEEDFELDTPEVIESKNTEINQPIETHHHQQQQPYLYEMIYPPSILEQHNYPASEYNYAMDISPIEQHIVDPNSLHLQFDHPDQLNDELFCDFQPKMYPSPPYEAAMLEIASSLPWEQHNM